MTDSLLNHPSTSVIKLLQIGESGSGKSGALASLASAGYDLHILDYDNGLDVLANILKGDKAALERVKFRTLRDTITMRNGIAVIKSPVHAYKDAGKTLQEWDVESFTPNDIIVLDTLTTFSEAAFNEALALGSRLNLRPQIQDYGWMADSVKLFIELLTDPSINCHVIVSTHIRYFAADEESQTQGRGLPNAKGQQISKDVGKYFNTIVLTRTQGAGPATKRIISTVPQGIVEVKNSSPNTVQKSYDISTGLASLFHDILGHGPSNSPRPLAPEAKPSTATEPNAQTQPKETT